jgi:hypothetical protein
VLIIPGLFWAFRNYKLLGQLFPDSTMSLQAKSIFSLFSQLIGNGLPLSGKIVLILIITSIFLLIVQKKFTRIPLIILASLILIFIFTPASANFSEDGTFVVIQWRFGLALLGYLLILMLYVSESFILRVYQFILDSRIFFWITILLVFSDMIYSKYIHKNRQLSKIIFRNPSVVLVITALMIIFKRIFMGPRSESTMGCPFTHMVKGLKTSQRSPHTLYGQIVWKVSRSIPI